MDQERLTELKDVTTLPATMAMMAPLGLSWLEQTSKLPWCNSVRKAGLSGPGPKGLS